MSLLNNELDTNVTHTIHREPYPAIDPTRPELSQAGKTALITGGSGGIGFAIAKAFITASASTVIVTGRRQDKLDTACESLKDEAVKANKGTRIIGMKSDAGDLTAIDALWASLAGQGIIVDVLVLNAAKFGIPKPLLELGIDQVWSAFESNVRGPLHYAMKFHHQPGDEKRPKFLLNVSAAAIHLANRAYGSLTAERPDYALSKGATNLAMQYVAQDVAPERMQIISFHPGCVCTEPWQQAGFSPDSLPFDDPALAGYFAVWAASKEARFLHGRFVWASWDVNELAQGAVKKKLDSDVEFFRMALCGLKGTRLAEEGG